MSRRRYAYIAAVLLVAAAATLSIRGTVPDPSPAGDTANYTSLDAFLQDHNVSAADTEFTIDSVETETVAGVAVDRVTATAGDRHLRVELLHGAGPGFADTYLQDRRSSIISVYTESQAPYDGLHLDDIDCPDRFHPDISRSTAGGVNYTTYTFFANADREVGACTDTAAYYRGRVMAAYCPGTDTVMDIALFTPVNRTVETTVLDGVRCGG